MPVKCWYPSWREPSFPVRRSDVQRKEAIHILEYVTDQVERNDLWYSEIKKVAQCTLSDFFDFVGGPDGTRTRDPLRDRQVF